jgi:hypothetical protein
LSGKVSQVGTQNRSNSLYQQARQMVEQGMIGDIHYARAFWGRRLSAIGTRAAISNGGFIQTIRAGFRPIFWFTRLTLPTSFATAWCRRRA